MFPLITYYTLTVMLLPLLLLFSRVFRIWRLTMSGERPARAPLSLYVLEAWIYVYQSVTHSLMRKCPEKGRWLGHWMLATGVVMMLTIKVFALRWFQTDNIYPLYHPQRWLGYLATGLILYGLGDIFVGRLRAQKEIYKESTFQDLIFPILLVLTVLSGLAAHIFRYAGFALTCHFTIRPARHHRDADAAGGDVVWKVVAHGLSTASPVFPGGPGESRAAGARGGGGSPCPLRNPKPVPVGAALVVGGGIGGMQAALDLANGGIKVYLAERGPAIGGVMAQLDKTFPTNDCAMCTMAPRLVEIGRHKDIEILTLSRGGTRRWAAGKFHGQYQAAAAFYRRDEMHGLRCVRDGLSSDAAVRIRSGAGRAEGDLPAVPASRSQYLQHFAPRNLSLPGWMPHPSERAGLCDSDRARTLRRGAPGHSAR